MHVAIVSLFAACASGCGGSRVVFVTPDAPIRIGPDVTGHVYHLDDDGSWQLSANRVRIPEGWLCVSPEDGE